MVRFIFSVGPASVYEIPAKGGIMLGGLLFIVCVVLQFHYHDLIPWYIWLVAVIALCVSFGEPAIRSAVKMKKE
jgi:hypothetical protein